MYITIKDCQGKRFSHKDGWNTLIEDGDFSVQVLIEDGTFKRGVYYDPPCSGAMAAYNLDGYNVGHILVGEFLRKFRAGKLFLH